jgi:hypothetical protein
MYISRLVKTRDPHPGLLQIAILFPHFPCLPISTSCYLLYLHFISSIVPSLLSIYHLSILVEVLLRLLTYREDLVLLYLVSKYHC